MPPLPPSPPELIDRFAAATSSLAGVERRRMFGYPALFVGGNLATGLHGTSWMVRHPPNELQELLALPGSRPFEPMPGRAMKGYGVLPPDVVADDAALAQWLDRAVAHARTFPEKR